MNTEHLVYILEAFKCGSVNKAAKNCYISQSHLSAIIKNVEDEIGYTLFRRTPQRHRPHAGGPDLHVPRGENRDRAQQHSEGP